MAESIPPFISATIPTSEVRLSPQHATARHRDDEALARSIEEAGMLQPIWAARSEERWEIVAGHRRALAAQRIGLKEIPARDVSALAGDGLGLRRAGLIEHAHSTGFNLMERCAALKGMIDHYRLDSNAILSGSWMEILGWRPNGWVLADALAIAELPGDTACWLQEIDMGLKPTAALARLGSETVDRLAQRAKAMRLGPNRIRPLVALVEEIAARDGKKAAEVLEETPIEEGPRAYEKMMKRLNERRTPRLARLRENLQERIDALQLPPTVGLEIPPTFESGKVQLRMRAGSAEEFRKGIDRLAQSIGDERLDELYRFLREGMDEE